MGQAYWLTFGESMRHKSAFRMPARRAGTSVHFGPERTCPHPMRAPNELELYKLGVSDSFRALERGFRRAAMISGTMRDESSPPRI